MRAICKRETLIKNIGVVQRAVSSRSTLPILNNIFLETKNGRMRAVATDLEIGIETQFEVNAQEEGTITVPSKYLLEMIRRLPSEEIEFAVEKDRKFISSPIKRTLRLAACLRRNFPPYRKSRTGRSFLSRPRNCAA